MIIPDLNHEESLKKTLYQLRLGTGLTQTDLADRLNIPQSTISKIESGLRRLDILELRNYCHAVGIPLLDFIQQLEKNINEAK